MPRFRRIGVTVKTDLPEKEETVNTILAILKSLKADIFIDSSRMEGMACAKEHPPLGKDIDLLLVIGGDGTILRAIRELHDYHLPILSVNRGAVGFLAETNMEEASDLLPKLLNGEGVIEERKLLRIEAYRGKKELFKGYVLNEAVIAQGAIARLVDLMTTVNGEPLTTFHSDGLIIATPTGSTAYSLAAGGPIVHPSLSAMILTPLNPHSFSQKPIVIPGTHYVEVEVQPKENKFLDSSVSLTLDGQTYVTLERNDSVKASMSDQTIRFVRRRQDTFLGTLRAKLKWGERLED